VPLAGLAVKVMTGFFLIGLSATEADMQRGLWGRFGWMIFALVIVAGAALWLKEKISGSSAAEEEEKA